MGFSLKLSELIKQTDAKPGTLVGRLAKDLLPGKYDNYVDLGDMLLESLLKKSQGTGNVDVLGVVKDIARLGKPQLDQLTTALLADILLKEDNPFFTGEREAKADKLLLDLSILIKDELKARFL